MSRNPTTFYRYRAFNAITLDSLCHDTMHFANPGTFNDPLDCSPTLDCDSELGDLRNLYSILFRRRVLSEVHEALKKAGVRGERASTYADRRAQLMVENELANIAYDATNPEHSGTKEEVEAWILTNAIEAELHRYYDRGVCCFSESYASPVLWSHYGDQHRGLCIGYGIDRIPKPQLQKVIYGKSRGIKTSALVRTFIHSDCVTQNELDRDVLLRKAGEWRYEHEWRLIGPQGLQESPLLLKEVTFGLRCATAVKHSVVKALSGRDRTMRFYEVYEVRGQYVLRRKQLDLDEISVFLPHTAVSGIEMFGSDAGTDDVSQPTEQAQ